MGETLETHEHVQHATEGGRRRTALLIAILAAALAFTEQGAQHAQTAMSADAIAAADLWAQYQAKSIRANDARELAAVASVIAPAGDARDRLLANLTGDADRFEHDKQNGKDAVADQARALEEARDHAHEKLEAFDNAAAAFQLAIVLTTASVIAESSMLVWLGGALGLLGAALGILGAVRPDWAVL